MNFCKVGLKNYFSFFFVQREVITNIWEELLPANTACCAEEKEVSQHFISCFKFYERLYIIDTVRFRLTRFNTVYCGYLS